MENRPALDYLETMIRSYKRKRDETYKLIDVSYSAFLDYANAKDFVQHLNILYYKLTNKEYNDNES